MATAYTQKDVYYPDSDGKPLAETGVHVAAILLLLELIRRRYAGDGLASALVNMFLYYEQGNPKKRVAPDVFLTLGVTDDRHRRTFKVWEEGKAPDLIVEVTSKSTKKVDLGKKFELYRDVLKVREYFLFDPLEEYLRPPLQGFRLVEGEYVPIRMVNGRFASEVIGVDFLRIGPDLRLFDPTTGRLIPTGEEDATEAWHQNRLAQLAKLKAEVAVEHAEAAKEHAEAAKEHAEAARERAEAARERAEAERARSSAALYEAEGANRVIIEELERLRRENKALKVARPSDT
jgi:hypothetical protein